MDSATNSSSESASSSGTDSNTGIDADTESATSEEETDQIGDASPVTDNEGIESKKEKWIAVNSQQHTPTEE